MATLADGLDTRLSFLLIFKLFNEQLSFQDLIMGRDLNLELGRLATL